VYNTSVESLSTIIAFYAYGTWRCHFHRNVSEADEQNTTVRRLLVGLCGYEGADKADKDWRHRTRDVTTRSERN